MAGYLLWLVAAAVESCCCSLELLSDFAAVRFCFHFCHSCFCFSHSSSSLSRKSQLALTPSPLSPAPIKKSPSPPRLSSSSPPSTEPDTKPTSRSHSFDHDATPLPSKAHRGGSRRGGTWRLWREVSKAMIVAMGMLMEVLRIILRGEGDRQGREG